MNDVLPLPPAHPFSQGLPRPISPDHLRRRTPSPSPSSKSLPPLPTPRRAPSAASCAASVRSLGSLLSVPERRKRLSLHNYFLDIDIEYARSNVPRPKLIVTVVRPSPTEESFPSLERREKDRIGRSIPDRVEVLEGIEEWASRRVPEAQAEFGGGAEEDQPDIVIRRKNSRESKRERRRMFHASLERLAILESMLEETESDRERGPPPGLRGGPMSAPVAHAPKLVLETDLRRAKSLEYHPYSSPITTVLGHGFGESAKSSEHLDFEYLLSPAEISEEHVGRYELPALEFGPRLGLCLKGDWEALVEVPEDEELELGALLMPDIRGEWRHPFAAGGC